MIKTTLHTLALASLLIVGSGSALAGSTGPTNPVDQAPKLPAAGMEKNTDGTTPAAKGTSPGTKGMDPEQKTDGTTGGGMNNDKGTGGSGAGSNGSGSKGSSSGG